MLIHTFSHVQGIGAETERALWGQGCLTWSDYLSNPGSYSVGTASKDVAVRTIDQSREALASGNHRFFAPLFGQSEVWRTFESFREQCAYVDIETDGGLYGDSITLIGLYDGSDFKVFVKDDNLEEFEEEIRKYKLLVTFFGTGFDLPMIRKRFSGLLLDQLHLDLCPTLRNLGYRGGLKKIERQLGIKRVDEADGLDGRDAIRLWRKFQRGDDDALTTLVAYNREDVVNMELLAEIAVEGHKRHVRFPSHCTPNVM